MSVVITETRTIASAGTATESFDAGNALEGTFTIPSAFTGTEVTPQFGNDGTNWTAVGAAMTVAANGTYVIPADVFKAKFGRLLAATAQGAERTITLGLRR